MVKIFNYSLSINLNPYLLFLLIGIAVLYVVFIYKYTIPQTSKIIRVILISTRSIFLLLLLLLIFEPKLTVNNEDINKPIVPVFIDNSSSMKNYDPQINERIESLVDDISLGEDVDYKFFLFGNDITKFNRDSISSPSFDDQVTNFENVFNHLKNNTENVTSALIISDGIINDGSSSIYESEKLNFPVYTIGFGDTTKTTDVFVSSILNNRFIYKETPTVIAAEISNENLANEKVNVSFLENNVLRESKEVVLSEGGINRVTFDYTPSQAGKQKLTVQLSKVSGDVNSANNIRSTFIEILENKLNVLVISGSPSADFSAVLQSLSAVDEYNVNKYFQINSSNDNADNFDQKLDSSQVLVLVNFPNKNTSAEIVQKVVSKIGAKKTPLLNFVGSDIEALQLNKLEQYLPFTQSRSFDEVYLAQPIFSKKYAAIILGNSNGIENIPDLPPVAYPNGGFKVRPAAQILTTAKVNNIGTDFPMIISWDSPLQKSITFIGSNYWKWRINPDNKNSILFDQIIYNSVQWLRVSEDQRKFYVKTTKDIYAPTEEIEFIGEIYDDKLQPVDNSSILVNIESSNKNYSLKLSNQGNGLYKGSIALASQGDFNFSATADVNGTEVNQSTGKFNVGEVDLEKLRTVLQENYLKMIASLTGGAYTYIDNSKGLIEKIEILNRNKTEVRTSSITYDPLAIEFILILLILLLSIEWFIRKKEGML